MDFLLHGLSAPAQADRDLFIPNNLVGVGKSPAGFLGGGFFLHVKGFVSTHCWVGTLGRHLCSVTLFVQGKPGLG